MAAAYIQLGKAQYMDVTLYLFTVLSLDLYWNALACLTPRTDEIAI
jgi:hypothetical protein